MAQTEMVKYDPARSFPVSEREVTYLEGVARRCPPGSTSPRARDLSR